MKRILILTTFQKKIELYDELYQKESSFLIHKYFSERGWKVDISRYNDLCIEIASEVKISFNDFDLKHYDFIIFRSNTLLNTYGISLHNLSQVVAKYAIENNVPCINGKHLSVFPANLNKLYQMYFLSTKKIPIPKTFVGNVKMLLPQLKHKSFIVKPVVGSHGDSVHLLKPTNSESGFILSSQIVQEMLPGKADYRVLVLNHEILGVMKRTATGENIVSNFSAGGSVEKFDLTGEIKDLALEVQKLFQLDFCGVDLMKTSTGKLVVLEANRFPEFIGFQQVTLVNVPAMLFEYIEQRLFSS